MTARAQESRAEEGGPAAAVRTLLSDPTNLAHVRAWTTPDIRYVSLNDDNPELHLVMPWSGPGEGAEGIVRAFTLVRQAWEVLSFKPEQVFASGGDVAMFGHFTYRSIAVGKLVTTPFAIWAEVRGGKSPSCSLWRTRSAPRPRSGPAASGGSAHFRTARR